MGIRQVGSYKFQVTRPAN